MKKAYEAKHRKIHAGSMFACAAGCLPDTVFNNIFTHTIELFTICTE